MSDLGENSRSATKITDQIQDGGTFRACPSPAKAVTSCEIVMGTTPLVSCKVEEMCMDFKYKTNLWR